MFCTHCGMQLKESQTFCVNCGAPVPPAPLNENLPPDVTEPERHTHPTADTLLVEESTGSAQSNLSAMEHLPPRRPPLLLVLGLLLVAGIGVGSYALVSHIARSHQQSRSSESLAAVLPPPSHLPEVGTAVIRHGETSLRLPPGRIYVYGMVTGGAAPSTPFSSGQYAHELDAAGQVSVALAYGTNDENSYTTQTASHDIGGVSVAGAWKTFEAFHASNAKSGASQTSLSFQVTEDSLAVIVALASSQQYVAVQGIPELQLDASESGEGILIGHSYLKPGSYTVIEQSKATSAGQDPDHMADLVGVFVFGGYVLSGDHNASRVVTSIIPIRSRGALSPSATTSAGDQHRQTLSGAPGHRNGDIHRIDFLNFDYQSRCAFLDPPETVVHVINGTWRGADGDTYLRIDNVRYGDLTGGSSDNAVVLATCGGQANFIGTEIFVFSMSQGRPQVISRLLPPDWGKGEEDNGGSFGTRDFRVERGELVVRFSAGGTHCCPTWTDTARFKWIRDRFVRVGLSRKRAR